MIGPLRRALAVVPLLPALWSCSTPLSPSAPAEPVTRPARASPVDQPAEVPVAAPEAAVAPEKNPPGDIPDTQVFVRYTSPTDGFTLEVPEGWARTDLPDRVRWRDKLDGVEVSVTPAPAAPTAATSPTTLVPALQASGHAVQVGAVRDVSLPGGAAVRIDYHANSEPDSVTGKKVRLEASNYYFFHDGKLVTLSLWAPAGADNVDQWERMSRSLGWP